MKRGPSQDLFSVREVATVGSRPVADRPLLKRMGLKTAAAAVMVAGALTVAGLGASSDTGALSTPEEYATAQVVAKIWNADGALLTKGRSTIGDNQVWQPVSDAVGSSRQLVLALPGEIQPVVVAVSPEIYERYCRHVVKEDFMANPAATDATKLAACGATIEHGQPEPAHIALDQVQVSFTRSKLDGSIQLTQLDAKPKFANSFLDAYRLRQEFKAQLKSSATQAKVKGPA